MAADLSQVLVQFAAEGLDNKVSRGCVNSSYRHTLASIHSCMQLLLFAIQECLPICLLWCVCVCVCVCACVHVCACVCAYIGSICCEAVSLSLFPPPLSLSLSLCGGPVPTGYNPGTLPAV